MPLASSSLTKSGMAARGPQYPLSFEAAEGYQLRDLPLLEASQWRKVKTLGEAIFGKVYLVQATPELQKQLPGLPEVFALKQMPREAVLAGKAGLESARNELCAARQLAKLNMPSVAPIFFVAQGPGKGKHFEGRPCFFLATEYCELGELFVHLQRLGSIQCEHAMREVMWQLLDSLARLHEAGFAHRDVSLENLLVNSRGNIRLIDFAQAIAVHAPGDCKNEARVRHTCLGAPGKEHYRSPEVQWCAESYLATKLDVFASGVLLYTLAAGKYPPHSQLFPPEDADSDRCRALSAHVRSANLQDRISPGMLDFIEQLMAPNPEKRMTAAEALEHPWLKGTLDNYLFMDAKVEEEDCCMELANVDFAASYAALGETIA